jgi:hypothetical protein
MMRKVLHPSVGDQPHSTSPAQRSHIHDIVARAGEYCIMAAMVLTAWLVQKPQIHPSLSHQQCGA